MFGMDKGKDKTQHPKTVFDMETSLKSDSKAKSELEERMNGRIDSLKSMLKEGHKDQKEFEQMTLLLHGYHAMLKVIRKI